MPNSWRRTLFAFGILCLTLAFSLTGFLADGRAELPFPFDVALFAPPAPASPASSESTASDVVAVAAPAAALPVSTLPAPTLPRPGLFGGGPVTFSGTGTASLGVTKTSRYDFTQGLTSVGSEMNLTAERRTEQSSLTVTDSIGYTIGSTSSLGELQVGYRRPNYEIGYGPVDGPADTQLNLGGFAKGIDVTLPRPRGELTFVGASTTQQNGVGYRVLGVRRDSFVQNGTLGYSGFLSMAENGAPGREGIFDVVYHRYGAKLSTLSEVALEDGHDVYGVADGAHEAIAFQADLSGRHGFTTATVTDAPSGFATLASVTPPSLVIDLTTQRQLNRTTTADLDAGATNTGESLISQDDHSRRIAGSITRSLKFGTVSVVGNFTTDQSDGASTINRSGGVNLSQSVRGFNLTEAAQLATTSGTSGEASQRELDFGLTKQIGHATLAFTGSHNIQDSAGVPSTIDNAGIQYERTIGSKLDFTLGENVQSSNDAGAIVRSVATSVSLTRRLSSVVSAQAVLTRTSQSGIGGGNGNSFAFNLQGPVGFGGSRFTGRSNPNVPATIRGTVDYVPGTTLGITSAGAPQGYGNVLVVLDGKVSQRTDSRGEFEFRFVQQGEHTVTLEPGTLAAGLVPDHEVETLNVLGGQIVNMSFTLGSFAGIAGHLYVDRNGKQEGIGNVALLIDAAQRTTTAADGRYQVGRLSPGPHKVTIVPESVPSAVQFKSMEQSVVVSQGNISTVDFVGQTLGSIAGNIFDVMNAGETRPRGAKDIYVLAEPGDFSSISNEDGSFLLDNLPPGTYTLKLDDETLPDGLSVAQAPDAPFTLAGGQAITGAVFRLGEEQKSVVYTFGDGKRRPISVVLDPQAAAPGALVQVIARTTAQGLKTLYAESDVFGRFPLSYNPRSEAFEASFIAPAATKGSYALTVSSHQGSTSDGDASLTIDPDIKLVVIRTSPAKPLADHTFRLTAKIYAPVEEGDAVVFEDGYTLKLPKPSHRVYAFDMRMWSHGIPYTGEIVTKAGRHIPLIIR